MIGLTSPRIETPVAGGPLAVRPPVAVDVPSLPALDLWASAARWDLGRARTPQALAWPRRVAAEPRPRQAIAKLALISPYDPCSGVVANPLPLDAESIAAVEARGYTIVAPVDGQRPYAHVITTGIHDYLAALASDEERRCPTSWCRSPGRTLP